MNETMQDTFIINNQSGCHHAPVYISIMSEIPNTTKVIAATYNTFGRFKADFTVTTNMVQPKLIHKIDSQKLKTI